MALTAVASRDFRKTGAQRFKVGVSQKIWKGAAFGIKDDGLAYEWDATAGMRFGGFAAATIETNSSGYRIREGVPQSYNDSSTEAGYVNALSEERIVEDVTIAGFTLQSQLLHPVWMTDDDTFTLTPQANKMPVGVVISARALASSTGDVMIFNYDQLSAANAADGGYQRQDVAVLDARAIGTTYTSALLTSFPLLGAGRITKMLIVVGRKISTHTCAVLFKLKLNGTFLKNTAGTFVNSVPDASMDTNGKVVSVNIASSTTHPAYFGPGDLLEVAGKSATAPLVGSVRVIVESARTLKG